MTHLRIPNTESRVQCSGKPSKVDISNDIDKVECPRCLREKIRSLELQLEESSISYIKGGRQ